MACRRVIVLLALLREVRACAGTVQVAAGKVSADRQEARRIDAEAGIVAEGQVAERSGINGRRRIAEVRVIEQGKRLKAELELHPLLDREVLEHGKIDCFRARPVKQIAAGIPLAEMFSRLRERYGIMYHAPGGDPGSMRTIRVDMTPQAKSKLKDIKIRARAGYKVGAAGSNVRGGAGGTSGAARARAGASNATYRPGNIDNLVGMDIGKVRDLAKGNGWQLIEEPQVNPTAVPNTVLTQQPATGANMIKGSVLYVQMATPASK